MLRTLSIVIAIGLADSLNASTIGPALVLASGEHPRRSVFEFALGVMIVFFLGGALLVLGPGRALLALVPHPSATAQYIVETVVGVGLITAALVMRRRSASRPRGADGKSSESGGQNGGSVKPGSDAGEDAEGAQQAADDGAGARRQMSPMLMGASIAAVELLSAAPYWAAIATIVSARLHVWQELLLVAVYDVCFVLPLFVIILVLTVAGERATQALERMRDQVKARGPALARGAALVVGVYVTVLGVTGLASGASGRTGRVSRRIHHVISK